MTNHDAARESAGGEPAIALLGSGAFAIPSFEAIVQRAPSWPARVALVVSQPDRPAGRGREPQPTPVSAWAQGRGLELWRTEDVNEGAVRRRLDEHGVRFLVVIAFGQKLSSGLLEGIDAVNLHGSILPRWRGAAPIQRSLMEADSQVGVSVIAVTEKMDAGRVFAKAVTEPGPDETAGELHDRLAAIGVEPLLSTASGALQRGLSNLASEAQDESLVTRARKLSREDAFVDFAKPSRLVAARINGLSPWPAVDAVVDAHPIKILKAREVVGECGGALPGTVLAQGRVACAEGSIELLLVQAPGGRPCSFESFLNGRRCGAGATLRSVAQI